MAHQNRERLTIDLAGNWSLYSGPLPSTCTAMGTVSTLNGGLGALVKFNGTGKFGQLNAGSIKALDGRKVLAAIGKAGRPSHLEQGQRVNVYLDSETILKAEKIGGGVVSKGVRVSVKAYEIAPGLPQETTKARK